MKFYSESRFEQRDPQILKKMLETSRQFLSSEQFCEPKSSDGALIIAVERVERKRSENMRLRSKVKVIRFEV